MMDHRCNKGAISRMRDMGVGLRGLVKCNMGVGTLEERYLRRLWEGIEKRGTQL